MHSQIQPQISALRFQQTRDQTMALVAGLSAEDCALQSMPDASPTKWHLAHTTWFFEVFVLEAFEAHFKPFDEAFRVLFNSYYNGVGEKHPRPQRGMISRPNLDRVLAYRREIEQRVTALLHKQSNNLELARVVELGINHEQQHQELLLTDLKHLFSLNPLKPAYRSGWPLVTVTRAPTTWLSFAGGLFTVGRDAGDFCFDNETPAHQQFLQPFEMCSEPILNADVLEFIDAKGYQRPELWLSMGWDWVQSENRTAPQYWRADDADPWMVFTLRGECTISPDVPTTHLAYFEADAIARWRGARLPTEAQWEQAAQSMPIQGNFLESGVFHPLALQHSSNSGVSELIQLWGDSWEWTQSAYSAYPGFKAAAGALGEYNGKFMCNQFVLKGGSCATPQAHIRQTYRNFFPPHVSWQFTGARLVRDLT